MCLPILFYKTICKQQILQVPTLTRMGSDANEGARVAKTLPPEGEEGWGGVDVDCHVGFARDGLDALQHVANQLLALKAHAQLRAARVRHLVEPLTTSLHDVVLWTLATRRRFLAVIWKKKSIVRRWRASSA